MQPFSAGAWVHVDIRGDADAAERLFWLPDHDPGVLGVHAEPVPPSDPEAFDIAAYEEKSDLVLDRLGHEFLLLDDGAHQIELHVRTGTLAEGPVRLHCEMDLFSGASAKLLTASRLIAFRKLGSFPSNLFPMERKASKWILALRAYDGMQAGASLKEIATVLYSAKLVREEWNGRSDFLKTRVKRLLHYGRKMVNGGYRALLQ